ncbi:MAG: cation transporter [Lachnospiraceae bacterium]|nr:cation transporter [Lachnospiraceae bacterium]
MKKRFDMVDLDCANCAAKMEEAINKIEGVESATVSFMAQKLSIEAAEEDFEKIMKKVVKAIKKVDADCEVVL